MRNTDVSIFSLLDIAGELRFEGSFNYTDIENGSRLPTDKYTYKIFFYSAGYWIFEYTAGVA